MTTPAPRSPSPVSPPARPATPYVPAWCYYFYDQRAFLTFDGRLVATAAVATPAQEARIEGVFNRLAHKRAAHAARRSAPAERLSIDRRQTPAPLRPVSAPSL